MTPTHTIRLHTAWKRMVMGTDGSFGEPVSVSLPDRSLLQCDASRVTYQRHFNRPTGLSDRTSVLLNCGLLPLSETAVLNGQPLKIPRAGLPDITSLLRPHNELKLVLHTDRYAEASSASAQLLITEAPSA
jgi:hypothetical protein